MSNSYLGLNAINTFGSKLHQFLVKEVNSSPVAAASQEPSVQIFFSAFSDSPSAQD